MYHYKKWECYNNGMYESSITDEKVNHAVELLKDENRLYDSMYKVITEWVYSCQTHLTQSEGLRSWLGWAACSIETGANFSCTRVAWGILTENQKKLANMVADTVILQYKQTETKNDAQIKLRF